MIRDNASLAEKEKNISTEDIIKAEQLWLKKIYPNE